jgi:16S rRNA (guanine527-N7)-methyltransferase
VKQLDQLNKLHPLYSYWNQRINVISRKDIDQLHLHHVLHSLSLARFISFNPGSRVLDAGTGGGFPGVPLAIVFPDVEFTLIDSIGKKITVVEAVADALELKNLTASKSRIEDLDGEYDFIVSRAVARLKVLWHWTRHLISKDNTHKRSNGLICLKGGDLKEEIQELARPCTEEPISQYFNESYFSDKKIIHIPLNKNTKEL